MTFVDGFKDEMAQSVTISPYASGGLYGPSWGSGVAHACAVQHKIKNIIDKNGTAAVSSMQIYLDGAVTVGSMDKVVYGGITLVVLAIGKDYDIENPSEVYGLVIYT